MDKLKPALTALMLALSLASTGVYAQQSAPAAAAAPAASAPGADAEVKPASRRNPIKRRSVQQVIEPTPPIVTDGYRPTLTVRPPAPVPAPPPAPLRINSCDAGGCTDTSGQRYNDGVGNTLIGPQGQLCIKGVVNAQCF